MYEHLLSMMPHKYHVHTSKDSPNPPNHPLNVNVKSPLTYPTIHAMACLQTNKRNDQETFV